MVFVNNIKEKDFTKSKKLPHNQWLARFFETTEDGIVSCWEHVIDHKPNSSDYTRLEALCISLHKDWKKLAIKAYDTSDIVNGFKLNGQHAWLSKNDRASLRSLVQIQKEAGMTNTTLWYGETNFNLSCDEALAMLSALELYASQCYNKTAEHLAAVSALTTLPEVQAYDHTAGYPEQLSFTL